MKLTKKQRCAVYVKYCQDPDGALNYREFRRRVIAYGVDNVAMLQWRGMFLGIETDGYTHS